MTYGKAGDTAQSSADYDDTSTSEVTLAAGTPQTLRVPIMQDDLRELDETFTVVLTGRGSPDGTSATIEFQATIAAADDAVSLVLRHSDGTIADSPRVGEGGETGEEAVVPIVFDIALALDDDPNQPNRSATFLLSVREGTAKAGPGEDYDPKGNTVATLNLVEGTAPTTFPASGTIDILDDEESESAEYFVIELEATGGATLSKEFRVHIDDDDGPDPILREIGRHVVARTEALIGNQPRLIPMLRNPGPKASEYSLRLTDGGVDAAEGGFRGETLWGATTLSRAVDGHGEHEHLLATLGAHARMSERLHLGGMLQFDRSETRPGGEVVSGEIRGSGWMAGPYFAMRDASQPLCSATAGPSVAWRMPVPVLSAPELVFLFAWMRTYRNRFRMIYRWHFPEWRQLGNAAALQEVRGRKAMAFGLSRFRMNCVKTSAFSQKRGGNITLRPLSERCQDDLAGSDAGVIRSTRFRIASNANADFSDLATRCRLPVSAPKGACPPARSPRCWRWG